MMNNPKLKELLKITNISDKKLEKLNFKEKQKYYKAKSKLCTIAFVSRDKSGKGITYRRSNKNEVYKKI